MPLLHWLTRDDDIHAAGRTPYRLLEEMASHSQGDRDAGNMLIHGDNLDALKALLPSRFVALAVMLAATPAEEHSGHATDGGSGTRRPTLCRGSGVDEQSASRR